jgi:peptide/nickel transport system substrate-binding protein
MKITRHAKLLGALIAVVLVGCVPSQPARTTQRDAGQVPAPAAPKRVSAAVLGDPFALSYQISSAGAFTPPGSEALEELVHTGLTTLDRNGTLVPRLAEAVPTVENGRWKVLPDGRMETTWTIRSNAQWHDGRPVTADDLVFTSRVVQDREVGVFRDRAYENLEGVDAIDPRTVTARWKVPFIGADALFSPSLGMPQPKHVLEQGYLENKTGYSELPHWSTEFVGAGPYKLKSWERGSHLIVEANDGYVLGRPKIDEVEVRFITDSNTAIANVLSGTADFIIGRGLSVEQAIQVQERWREGRVESAPYTWIQLWPQLLTPNPQVIADAQFRKALMHAMDREEMATTLMAGLTTVAHSYLSPNEPDFADVEPSVIKYEFDQRRAMQLIEGLGYSRGADGTYADAAGRRLSVEVRANAGDDLRQKLLFSIADYWQKTGIGVEPNIVPTQRLSDAEWVTSFPGLQLTQRPNQLRALSNLHSTQSPRPDTNYTGSNISRYANPEFDALIDRYYVTISRPDRLRIANQIINFMTDQVLLLGLFYTIEPILVNNRVVNVMPRTSRGTHSWNAHEWDVRS